MDLINIGILSLLPVLITLFAFHSKIKRREKEKRNALKNRRKLSIELQKRDSIHSIKRSKSALKKKESQNIRKSVQFNEVVLEVLDTNENFFEKENGINGNGSHSNSTSIISNTPPSFPKIIKSSLKSGRINTPLRAGNYNNYIKGNNNGVRRKNIFPKNIINSDNGYVINIMEEEHKGEGKENENNKYRNNNKNFGKKRAMINHTIDINQLRLTPLLENINIPSTSSNNNNTNIKSLNNFTHNSQSNNSTSINDHNKIKNNNPKEKLITTNNNINSTFITTTTSNNNNSNNFIQSNNTLLNSNILITNTNNEYNNNNNITTNINNTLNNNNNNSSVYVNLSAIANKNTGPNHNNNNNNNNNLNDSNNLSLLSKTQLPSSSIIISNNIDINVDDDDTFNNYELPIKADTLPRVSINSNPELSQNKSKSLPRPLRPNKGHRRQSSVRLKCIY